MRKKYTVTPRHSVSRQRCRCLLLLSFALCSRDPVRGQQIPQNQITIAIDQLGYKAAAAKIFTVTSERTLANPAVFQLRDLSSQDIVMRGQLSIVKPSGLAAGETIALGDLSAWKKPGHFSIEVQGQSSPPLILASSIYPPLYAASLHCFSIVRSGIAIDDLQTGIRHVASHRDDALLDGTGGSRRDLQGGWYNAGDYGKWTMMTAISVSYMLHLYSLQLRSGHPDPALLREASWGLTWLLKMQDENGGVRHKVDSGSHFAWGLPPQSDPNRRLATHASSLDTADFAAVMYQAERAFSALDPATAERYKQAANRAWRWLHQHPAVPASDPFYPSDDPREEAVWALCERALSVKDRSAERKLEDKFAHASISEVTWADPMLLGIFSLAQSNVPPSRLRETAARTIVQAANRYVALSAASAFRVALGSGEYTWGSVERVLHRAALLAMANTLQPNMQLREACLNQIHFILGRNPLGFSFVTGFGTHRVQHPYHWTYMAFGKVMPGWAVGGPNGSAAGADMPLKRIQQLGTPPEKCYVDLCSREGSWASNEGQISENAALVFVSGYLVQADR